MTIHVWSFRFYRKNVEMVDDAIIRVVQLVKLKVAVILVLCLKSGVELQFNFRIV